jgi:predicted nucleic acid-binding protein
MPETGQIPLAVCNAGPLIALAKINHLDLLDHLFGRLLVPEAVVQELSQAARLPEASRILATRVIERVTLAKPPDPMLVVELGLGEAQVIAAALEKGCDRVLIDERKARRVASVVYGLKVIGTGGLLLKSKQQGLIATVRPLMQQMKSRGYFLSDRLIEGICHEAGE